MAAPSLAKLLILQERDQRLNQVETMLRQWPQEKAKTESDIAKEKARVTEAEAALKDLEARRLALEGEVEAAEEKIVKYRTQQLEIKKQDAYDALEHEIALLKEFIDEQETAELDVLEEISESETTLEGLKAEVADAIATYEAHLVTISEALQRNEAELDEAKAAREKARGDVSDESALQQYDFVLKQVKRFPIIVEIDQGKCKGCHLKVESEVESEARRGNQIVRCSNCGRMVYFDR
jgi:hypothetical protein